MSAIVLSVSKDAVNASYSSIDSGKHFDDNKTLATVITSQCPTKDWRHIIGAPTFADAISDRLLQHAYKIELKGDSIRKTKK